MKFTLEYIRHPGHLSYLSTAQTQKSGQFATEWKIPDVGNIYGYMRTLNGLLHTLTFHTTSLIYIVLSAKVNGRSAKANGKLLFINIKVAADNNPGKVLHFSDEFEIYFDWKFCCEDLDGSTT